MNACPKLCPINPGHRLNNGATVINAKRHLSGEIVVLAVRPGDALPYVTWRYNHADGSCYLGHYFEGCDTALKDYNAR